MQIHFNHLVPLPPLVGPRNFKTDPKYASIPFRDPADIKLKSWDYTNLQQSTDKKIILQNIEKLHRRLDTWCHSFQDLTDHQSHLIQNMVAFILSHFAPAYKHRALTPSEETRGDEFRVQYNKYWAYSRELREFLNTQVEPYLPVLVLDTGSGDRRSGYIDGGEPLAVEDLEHRLIRARACMWQYRKMALKPVRILYYLVFKGKETDNPPMCQWAARRKGCPFLVEGRKPDHGNTYLRYVLYCLIRRRGWYQKSWDGYVMMHPECVEVPELEESMGEEVHQWMEFGCEGQGWA